MSKKKSAPMSAAEVAAPSVVTQRAEVDGIGAETVAMAVERLAVLPLLEERAEISIERVDIGALRVRIEVAEQTESAEVELVSTEVQPQRVVRGIEVDERREPYLDGEVLVVPVYEERLVLRRQLVLTEELRLTRMRQVRAEPVNVPLRHERAVVERQQADGSWRAVPALDGDPRRSDLEGAQ